jgi:hypothetical protein
MRSGACSSAPLEDFQRADDGMRPELPDVPMTGRYDAHGSRDHLERHGSPWSNDAESTAELPLDEALLDALDRGELPAQFREDVTARLRADRLVFSDAGPPRAAVAISDSRQHAGATVLLPEVIADPTMRIPLPAIDFDETDISGLAETRPRPIAPAQRRPPESAAETVVLRALALNPDGSPLAPSADRPDSQHDDGEPRASITSPHRRRRRRFDRLVVAGVAAAAIIGAGSAGSVAFAGAAQPGDTLWPISRVVYPDRAKSVEAKVEAQSALNRARQAVDDGDTSHARAYLAEAREKSRDVRDAEGAATLRGETDAMLREIDGSADTGADTQISAPADTPQRRHRRSRTAPPSAGPTTPGATPSDVDPSPSDPATTETDPAPSTTATPEPSISAQSTDAG